LYLFIFFAFYLFDFSPLSPNIPLGAAERHTSFEVFFAGAAISAAGIGGATAFANLSCLPCRRLQAGQGRRHLVPIQHCA
jgi:hypothetical protein